MAMARSPETCNYEKLKSQRGCNKIAHDGYLYTKEKDARSGTRSYWRCQDRQCPGRGILSECLFSVTKDHVHGPSAADIEVISFQLNAQFK